MLNNRLMFAHSESLHSCGACSLWQPHSGFKGARASCLFMCLIWSALSLLHLMDGLAGVNAGSLMGPLSWYSPRLDRLAALGTTVVVNHLPSFP